MTQCILNAQNKSQTLTDHNSGEEGVHEEKQRESTDPVKECTKWEGGNVIRLIAPTFQIFFLNCQHNMLLKIYAMATFAYLVSGDDRLLIHLSRVGVVFLNPVMSLRLLLPSHCTIQSCCSYSL